MMTRTAVLLFISLAIVGCASAAAKSAALKGIGDTYYPYWGNPGYDVLDYTLDLSVDVAQNVISGTATIEARATQPLSTFTLDFQGFTLNEVAVNSTPAQYDRTPNKLRVIPQGTLQSGGVFTTVVSYRGVPVPFVSEADKQQPVNEGWIRLSDGAYAAGEPSGAAGWYPVNNHPRDKALYTFRITVPKPYRVVANGLLQDTIYTDTTNTYIWQVRDPVASYLATVTINQYQMATATGPEGLPIHYYFPSDMAESVQSELQPTPEMIAFFNHIFGPYPFEAYSIEVMDESNAAATGLETQMLTLFFRQNHGQLYPGMLAHELAHQWFGNSVSLKNWQDLWLKEGFATYAEWLWQEHQEGPTAITNKLNAPGYYEQFKQRFQGHPPGKPPVDNLYDDSVYERGAMTLHALRLKVGDQLFFKILQEYSARYRYGNASTADFIAVAEEISQQDLGRFFEAWLYADDVPNLPVPSVSH